VAPRRLTRREFVERSAGGALGLLLSSCTPAVPEPRPSFGKRATAVDTRWPIKRVVYLMLENRSFDNLFGRFPGANGATVGVREGREIPLARCPEWLPGDLPHDLAAARLAVNDGDMDGFAQGLYGSLYAYSQFDREDVPNYWHWAENFVLSDNFFASVEGPSFPNHLYFIAGQSGGAVDNPEFTGIKEEGGRRFKSWGCDAFGRHILVFVRDENGHVTKHRTCFDMPTVGEQLTQRGIDWAYYAAEPYQAGYIWSAYSAIPNVFYTELWDQHVWPVDNLLADIEAEALPAVTWITPQYSLSDHPPFSTCHAHNWVTDVVNAIMRSSMWESVAIFITWDEWGGLYDHVRPPKVDHMPLGFRVPALLISPYAKRGYIDRGLADFTSPLRFIADNWGVPYLSTRMEKMHNFEHAFDFSRQPRNPDPRPRKRDCFGAPGDFPEEYPGWPDDVEPDIPIIKS
jgi:phospholipase C